MGRILKGPGIDDCYQECDFFHKTETRLLLAEGGHMAVVAYMAIFLQGQKDKGYFYDASNTNALVLLADDVKLTATQIKEVIALCCKYDLFSERIFNAYQVLTNSKMQSNWIAGTKFRRKKNTVLTMVAEYMIGDIEDIKEETCLNVINRDGELLHEGPKPKKKDILEKNGASSQEYEDSSQESNPNYNYNNNSNYKSTGTGTTTTTQHKGPEDFENALLDAQKTPAA